MEYLERINRIYWKTIIGLAAGSGMDERDWCMEKRVPINTYYRYKERLSSLGCMHKSFEGLDRARYYEIPDNRFSTCISGAGDEQSEGMDTSKNTGEECERARTESGGLDEGSATNTSSLSGEQRHGAEWGACLKIQIGGCCLYVRDGISEETLLTAVKAVMGSA